MKQIAWEVDGLEKSERGETSGLPVTTSVWKALNKERGGGGKTLTQLGLGVLIARASWRDRTAGSAHAAGWPSFVSVLW